MRTFQITTSNGCWRVKGDVVCTKTENGENILEVHGENGDFIIAEFFNWTTWIDEDYFA